MPRISQFLPAPRGNSMPLKGFCVVRVVPYLCGMIAHFASGRFESSTFHRELGGRVSSPIDAGNEPPTARVSSA